MSAYVIYQGDITDETAYEKYKGLASQAVENHGGTYLVRGGAWTVSYTHLTLPTIYSV